MHHARLALPTLPGNLKRRLFWIFARTCFALYRTFPIFGSLRAAIGVIHRDGKFLVIQRNDGRGISLPCGLASWREKEEQTLRREVSEETGLNLTKADLRTVYQNTVDIRCKTSVFEAEVSGELKESWEGTPVWMTVSELEPQLVESQRPVLEIMRRFGDKP
jgi:8-oxo-dGTP pyrophosphatase MutT (NUDIX family)